MKGVPVTEITDGYSPTQDRPLKGYVATMGAYGAFLASLVGVGAATGRKLPKGITAGDLALIGVATHKLSRIISKDAITSPLRAPFTKYKEPAGAGELNEEVRAESSPGHAAGELVSCPFCLDVWVSTGFVAGLALAPRLTRSVAAIFASTTIADSLHFAYSALKKTE